MGNLKNIKDNFLFVEILKQLDESDWEERSTLLDMKSALTSINLQTNNGGLYDPVPIKIDGLNGIFMINENDTIWFEHRIVKIDAGWRIERLSSNGFNKFEKLYSEYHKNR